MSREQQPDAPPCVVCGTRKGRRWLVRGSWSCENLAACVRRKAMSKAFIIAGPLDSLDGERLYWSNDLGWVDRASATRFPDTTGTLPDEAVRWEAA